MRSSFVPLKDCTDRNQGVELLTLGIPGSTAGGMFFGPDADIPSWNLAELLSLLPVCFVVEYPNCPQKSTHSLFIYSYDGMWHCGYSVMATSNILLRTKSRELVDAVVELFKTLADVGYDLRNHFASEASSITIDGSKFCGKLFVGSQITFFKHYDNDTDNAEENHGDDSI